MALWGKSMGKEFFDKGANVQLGPGLCVARLQQNGRNFECLLRRIHSTIRERARGRELGGRERGKLDPHLLNCAICSYYRSRYLSGEDPFLGSILVKPAIEGIQSQGVIANAKHWVINSQETDRSVFQVELVPFVSTLGSMSETFLGVA